LFSQIQIYTQDGSTRLVDLSFVDRYGNSVLPLRRTKEELLERPSFGSTDITLPTSAVDADLYPVGCISARSGAATNDDAYNADIQGGETSLLNFYLGADNATANYLTFNIKLKDLLPMTVCDIDKMLYYPDPLFINLYFNGFNRFAWKGSSSTDPATGAAAVASCSITNIAMYICAENNPVIDAQLRETTRTKGLEIPIVYPQMANISSNANSNISYSVVLSRGYGSAMKAIIWSPYDADQSLETAQAHQFSHLITNGSGVTYQTYIDSVPIRLPQNFVLAKADQYRFNEMFCRKSLIQNMSQFQVFGSHIDSWCGDLAMAKVEDLGGYALGDVHTWSMNCVGTTLPSLQSYFTFLSQRIMVISGNRIEVVL
jgi:hypothetical protein